MKKRLVLALVAGLFTIGLISTHISMTKNGIISTASLKNISLMAKASAETGNMVTCFSSSVVRNGHTYYDCGPCTKVYDEKGEGTELTCLYGGS